MLSVTGHGQLQSPKLRTYYALTYHTRAFAYSYILTHGRTPIVYDVRVLTFKLVWIVSHTQDISHTTGVRLGAFVLPLHVAILQLYVDRLFLYIRNISRERERERKKQIISFVPKR